MDTPSAIVVTPTRISAVATVDVLRSCKTPVSAIRNPQPKEIRPVHLTHNAPQRKDPKWVKRES